LRHGRADERNHDETRRTRWRQQRYGARRRPECRWNRCHSQRSGGYAGCLSSRRRADEPDIEVSQRKGREGRCGKLKRELRQPTFWKNEKRTPWLGGDLSLL